MPLDRRSFNRTLLAAGTTAIVGIPRAAEAAQANEGFAATMVQDWRTGYHLHRSGVADRRFSPCSTFKIPLALMGFDSGVLKDAANPAWDYLPGVHQASREAEMHRTDPTRWEKDSVVWYSQEIAKRLGDARFRAYIDRFGYGNRDISGNPAKRDGLTQSWLMSSLEISVDEQVAFLGRMLRHRLVSAQAHALAESIIPVFTAEPGWRVHGKTGSGWLRNRDGALDRNRPLGWFVGWTDKGPRRVLFARVEAGPQLAGEPAAGPAVRDKLLADLAGLSE